MDGRAPGLLIPLLACLAFAGGCGSGETRGRSGSARSAKPNILFVVWDTVRADHLSLYGHNRPTTPHLNEWAKGARVFENCVAAGSTTVPAHASMFTGLLPTEHGANNEDPRLADQFETLAELLHDRGYNTYMFSENPHICRTNQFTQGFDVAEHPWSPQYGPEALRITLRKLLPQDRSHELAEKFKNRKVTHWAIKAVGELAQPAVENWLAAQDRSRPFFVFLNYMEAHRPLIPPRKYREQMMTPQQVKASYTVDRTWVTLWSYVFRLRSYADQELTLTSATYDAALLELDNLFRDLLEALQAKGYLENTIVVLVSDHGEHLGEHHLLDHQFSVYEPVMRVPLILHYPPAVPPGREKRPVNIMDLFPTLLELVGIDPPVKSKAISLLRPPEKRPRMGEYPAVMEGAFKEVLKHYPDFDPTPFRRTLRAYYDEPYKFIQASNGQHELYDLDDDPDELWSLIREQPQVAQRLAADLQAYLDSLQRITTTQPQRGPRPIDEDHRRRLRYLGYVDDSDEADEEGEPNSPDDLQNEKKP